MIDTKAIRNKILDLAVRGKLTEQLSEDGTAEELFRQIQAEKQALIKAGKIKKEKPLPEINEEDIPFDIPSSWEWVRIIDIAYLTSGNQYPELECGIPYVKVADMNLPENQQEITTSSRYTNNENIGIIPISSIIFPKRGGAILTNKKRLVIRCPIYIDSNTMAMTVYSSDILLFIKWWFESINLGDLYTGTSIPQVNNKDIYPMIVPLPPLAEQKRIVEKVEQAFSVLDIIDELQKKYADNMTVLKSKLIDLAIQGKLIEQLPEDGTAEELYQQIQSEKQALIKAGKIKKEKPLPEIDENEIPFEIPNNWKWVRLADIASTNIGLTYHPEDIVPDGTVVVRSSNIIQSKMDYTDLVKVKCPIGDNQYLNNNDIVICARNGSKALVGKCAIYEGKSGMVSFGAFMAVLRTPFYKYVFYYLLTNAFRRYFHSDDSKQINQVTQNILKEAIIPLPPLIEQNRIVERLDKLLAVCDELK